MNWLNIFKKKPKQTTSVPIEVGDDDVLLICYQGNLSNQQRNQIKAAFDEALKSGKSFVVLDGNPSLHVIKRGAKWPVAN